jgi:hypothetical protein
MAIGVIRARSIFEPDHRADEDEDGAAAVDAELNDKAPLLLLPPLQANAAAPMFRRIAVTCLESSSLLSVRPPPGLDGLPQPPPLLLPLGLADLRKLARNFSPIAACARIVRDICSRRRNFTSQALACVRDFVRAH